MTLRVRCREVIGFPCPGMQHGAAFCVAKRRPPQCALGGRQENSNSATRTSMRVCLSVVVSSVSLGCNVVGVQQAGGAQRGTGDEHGVEPSVRALAVFFTRCCCCTCGSALTTSASLTTPCAAQAFHTCMHQLRHWCMCITSVFTRCWGHCASHSHSPLHCHTCTHGQCVS